MTKRKANSDSPSPKRVARSWINETDISEATAAVEKIFSSWKQCLRDQHTASTRSELAAIVESSSRTIDFINNTVLPKFFEFRAEAYSKQKQHHSASRDMEEIIKRVPPSITKYRCLGDIWTEHGHFAEALEIYEQGLKAIPKHSPDSTALQLIIDTMEARIQATVNSFMNQCNISKAARAAEAWIRLYPTSLKAYYTAGNVYMLQGRPDYAVKTYQNAISHAVQQGEPSWICRWKPFEAAALAQQKKHIDFIATMPLDLVSSILIHLPSLTLVECMTVSKIWLERVDGCHSAWNTITVGETKYHDDKKDDKEDNIEDTMEDDMEDGVEDVIDNRREYNIEQHVAYTRFDGIKKLWIGPWLSSNDTRTWMNNCFQFDNIKTLVLRNIKTSGLDTKLLMITIGRISRTLTMLELSVEGSLDTFISLWGILASARRLTHFLYMDTSYKRIGDDVETIPEMSSLTHLSLPSSSVWSYRDVEKVFDACPNLCYLSTDVSLTHAKEVRCYLKNLQHLSMNSKQARDPTLTDNTQLYGSCDELFDKAYSPTNGIRSISIGTTIQNDPMNLYCLLHDNQDTLEELTLQERPLSREFEEYCIRKKLSPQQMEYEIIANRKQWNTLSEFNSNSIKVFNCHIDWMHESVYMSIFHQCPMLESISLSNNTQITDKLFKVLAGLKRLHSLRIRNCKKITSFGLASFLDSVALYRRNLTKFSLQMSAEQSVSDTFFDSLAKVQTITTLELATFIVHGNALGNTIERLIALENIVLCNVDLGGITDILMKLSKLLCLKSVKLDRVAGVEKDAIVALASNSISLDTITLRKCGVHLDFTSVYPYHIRVL